MLQPNDQIQILSKLTYIDDFSVRVAGAVRSPGEYQYHPSLSLKDVLTLSGGLKMTASSNRIDIFRVVINNNELTKSIVATVAVDENLEMSSEFKLEPFDQIVVRSVPEFELQQFVTIEGEVKFPGPYALIDDNEKLTNLIKRAGGLTEESFPAGATLYREDGGTGFVVLRLDEALKSNNDIHNFILKKGDVIIKLDGVAIEKFADLTGCLGSKRPKDTVAISIIRDGEQQNVDVILKKLDLYEIKDIGIEVTQTPSDVLKRYDLEGGVSIKRILRPDMSRYYLEGAIITQIDDKEIGSIADVREIMKTRDDNQPVKMTFVSRKGETYNYIFR